MMEKSKSFSNAKSVFVVVDFPLGHKGRKKSLQDAFNILKNSYKVSCILHEKDFDENGKLEVPHCHLLIESEDGFGKSTWISKISEVFNGFDRDLISVQVTENKVLSLRYLCHLDHEKTPHDPSEVLTNDKKAFETALTQKPTTALSEEEKLNILFSASTPEEYVKLIGFKEGMRTLNGYIQIHRAKAEEDKRLADWRFKAQEEFNGIATELNHIKSIMEGYIKSSEKKNLFIVQSFNRLDGLCKRLENAEVDPFLNWLFPKE